MSSSTFQIYVGMALTEAPEEFRTTFQDEVKSALRVLDNVEMLDFIGLQGGTAVDVFKHDIACTTKANLCVFIVEHPSIGLGMEIMQRYHTMKPMMIFAREGQKVTRMVTGMLEQLNQPLLRYESAADIVRLVDAFRSAFLEGVGAPE